MAGTREYGEPVSYDLAEGETFDAEGYALEAVGDGSGEVQRYTGEGPFMGVNFVSTENQKEQVVEPDSGQLDVVSESAGQPFQAVSGEYTLGADVYLNSDGIATTDDAADANRRAGRVARPTTLDERGKVIVKFDSN